MPLVIGVTKELTPGERRVALVPDVAKKYQGLGAVLQLQVGAGETAYYRDEDFGVAELSTEPLSVLQKADVILQVQPLGLEALAHSRYDTDAVALTDISVCRIPLAVIQALGAQSPRLHRRLMEKWSRTLKEADDWLADLNFGTARNRVCNFVLKMRSSTDAQYVTLFAREDMGAMLDLKMETVSREISALVREQTLEPLDKNGRAYRIVNIERLQVA